MSNESNRSYRIRTNVNSDTVVNVNINQDIDMLEILSLKISTEDIYKLHTSSYGVVVGRVLANGGVGVPNAKISVFIEANEETLADDVLSSLYPYTRTTTKNSENIRYNLLPDEQVKQCHQQIGTMPNKCLVLDDDNTLEIFDQYYKFTTRSNNAGDYMIFGVPVGNQTIHVDIDLSDIGLLSQKPIDMMYKGYNATQFENASQFKKDTNLDSLPQVVSQNSNVYVYPFWGDTDESEIKITRNDIDVDYKFEPTCIFIGSMVTDDKSNGISKKCIPPVNMGRMDRLTTGSGTIEMIRKKPDGTVEEYPIMGNQLIDGNGTWCYQIPMNLDYITTDEYGNMVPTDDPTKGIATRARVRFRVSLSDFESDYTNIHLSKLLVPNNPHSKEDLDYVFGSATLDKDDGTGSFRDLFWNNVYTVKSYIPRIQKGNNQRTKKFTGFKNVNVHNSNNPIPYNNMRVNITFMFVLQCAIIKAYVFLCRVYNWLLQKASGVLGRAYKRCAYIGDGVCPDLEGWYFAPACDWSKQMKFSIKEIAKKNEIVDPKSGDVTNNDGETICLTYKMDYFMQCIEINLAMENEVIQFDFYNDWINGLLYIPRWMVNIRKKRSYLFGLIRQKARMQACSEENFGNIRRLTQQCALTYGKSDDNGTYTKVTTPRGCKNDKYQKCHKSKGRKSIQIFGKTNRGLIHRENTLQSQSVYYPKPCEWHDGVKCNFFATDIVLLGNINSCNEQGIVSDLSGLVSSTFQLPPNLVQTNMDSDGILYAMGTGFVCLGQKAMYDNGPEVAPQTFEGYLNWSKGQEFYEKNPDDAEYAVTEISGIDWGVTGPNQDSPTLNGLFMPGGHFLGIACVSSQVNIKSCVNLSRVCELGAMMSQRQYNIVKKDESTFEYIYLIPSGLVSKDEIGDNNYRSIFATLNHNRLKTEINKENLLRKYNFISIKPTNFNGELKRYVENSKLYNVYKGDETNGAIVDPTDAYVRTYEDNSLDYYRFRLGLLDNEEDPRSKYLLNYGSTVSMPVFENSFYFYFGLKDGSTAVDRFLQNYYSPCPSMGKDQTPSIEINVRDYEICKTNGGAITVYFHNFPTPFAFEILDEDRNTIEIKEDNIEEKWVSDETFKDGEYYIHATNSLYGVDVTKRFTVNKVLPTDENVSTISFYGESFITSPTITNDNGTVEISPENNGGIINIELIKKEKIIYTAAIIIANGYYYKISYEEGGFVKYNLQDIDYDYILKEIGNGELKEIKNNLYNSKKLKVWSENDTYDIYGVFQCSDEDWCIDIKDYNKKKKEINEELNREEIDKGTSEKAKVYGETKITFDEEKVLIYIEKKDKIEDFINFCQNRLEIKPEKYGDYILLGSVNINVLIQPLDFYIYDESLKLEEIKKILTKESGGTYFEIDVNQIKNLDPTTEWMVKKAIFYNTALGDKQENEINVGIIGGTSPYKMITQGFGERIDDEEGDDEAKQYIYVSSTPYEDSSAATNFDYTLDINSILVPTKPWTKDDIKAEINDYCDDSSKFIQLLNTNIGKGSYYLQGSDSKGIEIYKTFADGGGAIKYLTISIESNDEAKRTVILKYRDTNSNYIVLDEYKIIGNHSIIYDTNDLKDINTIVIDGEGDFEIAKTEGISKTSVSTVYTDKPTWQIEWGDGEIENIEVKIYIRKK